MLGLFGSRDQSTASNTNTIGTIRVAIVGPTGVGKSALAHLIAEGTPPKSSLRSTAGCYVHLKLITYPEARAHTTNAAALAGREFWVEIWDIGAARRYESIRPMYYSGINGAIVVCDLTSGRGMEANGKWARELATLGTFQSPYPEEKAARNLGGLPVPCLLIGNKLDLVNPAKLPQTAHSPGLLVSLQNTIQKPWIQLRSSLYNVLSKSSSSTPTSKSSINGGATKPFTHHSRKESDLSAHVGGGGIQAAAIQGVIDWSAVDEFLYQLIERRFAANSTTQDIGSPFSMGSSSFSHSGFGSNGSGHPGLGLHLTKSGSIKTGGTSLRLDDML